MEGLDRFTDEITAFFRGIPAKDREQAISAIRDILDRELFDCCSEDLDPACPACGCEDYVRNGHTAAGTQRYRCSRCGKTFAFRDVGRILLNTKLPHETWMRYAECFVDGLTCPKVAIRLGVTPKTAWFMRIRTLEALSKNLPSFEVKSGCGCQVDELYFAESFKGVSLRNLGGAMPREPRRGRGSKPRGISDEQICVVTGVSDNGDMFYDVACCGAMTNRVAIDTLRNRISSGAVVNTDKHRSYSRVLAELEVAFHARHDSKEHKGLERIDNLHSQIGGFMRRFNGVSTKWLHLYLAWFKWLREFRKSDLDNRNIVSKQISSGSYEHLWASINKMSLPFRDGSLNPTKV